ncbi:ABC-type branched-subunit amino acid transport system ATPase component [Mycolicibacterium iranicum]|uniref:ABC-type branched-subunit amino acid transport system ATPase component n=1 Tax=Mycolicibacterium iranicum TaxID=912594 RepID=A0A839Q2E5_MYCIR|nr:ABC transporter ATP-binding protein [Mycolicibacterium iranicum]MBB2990300.1 ABC-type branched-subunit amino acid transport system ATPase component [Mycolicibacterium iranicum]
MTATADLEVVHVDKTFGGVRALNDVTISISSAEITALIGPNGAGKTTLFNVISGFGTPYTGRVVFDGRDLTGLPAYKVARAGLVRTFQTPVGFSSMTVVENVALALAGSDLDNPWSPFLNWRKDRCRRAEANVAAWEELERADAAHLGDREMGDLSPGDAKLVEILRQLALAPRMLLLDEPAAAMTVNQIDTLSGIIRGISERGIGVLVIDHNLSFVLELAATVHVLETGAVIASGTPEQIGNDPNVKRIYLGGAEDSDVA